jgi:uncharacterized protein
MLTCISPHPDDAALSCGGLLAMEAARCRPGHVVTILAGPAPSPEKLTTFARAVHHEWGDLADPTTHRRQEDACALEVLGCTGTCWDYLDAIYRHPAYDSNDHLFGTPADEAPFEEELRARCAALPGERLLFPLAIGHHVDHQLLFRVGWSLAQAGRPVAFYEDMPYVAWENSPAARLAELDRPLFPQVVEITPFWRTKVEAVSCYASQFASLARGNIPLLEALERYATSILPGRYTERMWHPSPDTRGGPVDLIAQARALYRGADAAHDFDHVLRILALVRRIGPAEGADMRILEVATLLHDIARADEARSGLDHARAGAERAQHIALEWGYTAAEAAAIAQIIAVHRFRNSSCPETIEAQVLYDADKLDAIGAIGVGRAFAYAGRTGQHLWSPVPVDARATRLTDPSQHSPTIEFAVKLSRLAGSLHTATARAIARERHAFMVAFFERLEAEVRGEQ